ncbi:MAG: VOC family protein [Actinomycetaceae bacterium]|nr:VOC family protein [Actinomycetaceae bacterium]MDY5853999.1 VOC family protein [Arcanobacterium sp.]
MKHPKLAKVGAYAFGAAAIAHLLYHGPKDYRQLRELGKDEFIAEKRRELRTWHPLARSYGFAHAGVTVSDFDASMRWYNRVFGMKLINYLELSGDELRELDDLYHIPGLNKVQLGFMVGSFGMIELFQFDPALDPNSPDPAQAQAAAARETWNRPGYTHICFNVRNLPAWIDKIRGEGLEFLIEPQHSAGTDWIFFRDPDGNLIELMDMHATRLAVQHLGSLVGEVMKHTALRGHYQA